MHLQMIPLTEPLASEAAQVSLAAFRGNLTYRVCMPNFDSPESVKHESDRFIKDLRNEASGPNPTKWHMLVVDSDQPEASRKILSYTNLYVKFPPAPGAEDEATASLRAAPPDANMEAFNIIAPLTARLRGDAMGRETKYIYLALLATAEAARNRGAASMLLDWVMEKGKELGLPIAIQSTPEASAFYCKRGFRKIADCPKDLSPWVGKDEQQSQNDPILRWDP